MNAFAGMTIDHVTLGREDDPRGWQEFVSGEVRVEAGEPRCRIKLMRARGNRTAMQRVAFFACEPSTFRWRFAGDEAWLVLQGRLTITLDDGRRIDMGPGDAVTVPAGHDSLWEVHEPFLKFVVNTAGE